MSNYTYTVTWKGAVPHDYYLYEPSASDKTASRFDFHVTIPCTDKVRGSYGTYPHITFVGHRNNKKKWVYYDSYHWYIYHNEKDEAVVVDSSGTAIDLSSDERLFLEKVNADMKEYKALPWVSGAAKSTKSKAT